MPKTEKTAKNKFSHMAAKKINHGRPTGGSAKKIKERDPLTKSGHYEGGGVIVIREGGGLVGWNILQSSPL